MSSKLQQFGLVATGLVAGVFLSLNFSASANKEAASALPIEELRRSANRLRKRLAKLERANAADPEHEDSAANPLQLDTAATPPQLCADATGSGNSHALKATTAMTAKRIEKRIVNLQVKIET